MKHFSRVSGVLVLGMALLVPRWVNASVVTINCPSTGPSTSTTFVSEVTIDAGTQALGAYTLAIIYDPAVVVVASIAGGTTVEFGSLPIVNPADFPTGRTRLLAFNSASLTSPTGDVSVARITFNVLGLPGSSTSLAIEITTLADTNGSRIAADTVGCSVAVATTMTPGGSPTRTLSVPTVTPSPTPTATALSTLVTTAAATLTPPASPTIVPVTQTRLPTPTGTVLPAACSGDCNGDGMVTVDELLRGVNSALGNQPTSECPSFDRSGDGVITVDEIILGVKLALDGCPQTPMPSRTSVPSVTAISSPTPTPTTTASPTTTPAVNHAPVLPGLGVYHAYPGFDVRLAIGGSDPDGDRLSYSAPSLPDGAELDPALGVIAWTPRPDQLGPQYVPFTCADDGAPRLTAQGLIVFEVSHVDACTTPVCDPALGCRASLPAISESCCTGPPQVRVAEPLADCPQGRVLFVGRNNTGFGRLQNCDQLRVINFLQTGASVRFHVEARCVDTAQPAMVHARLETQSRLLFDLEQAVILEPSSDGYARKVPVVFPVTAPGPFFDFEGAEAQLSVTLTDADGAVVQERLRLVLTFDALDDLPETADIPAPSQ